MNRFATIFLISVFLLPGFSVAQECALPEDVAKEVRGKWTGIPIDLEKLFHFACEDGKPRSFEGILKALGKEDVLIVDLTDSKSKSDPISIYYQKHLDQLQASANQMAKQAFGKEGGKEAKAAAMFMAPHVYLSASDPGGPMMERSKILLGFQNRSVLIHEITHYLFYKGQPEEDLDVNGRQENLFSHQTSLLNSMAGEFFQAMRPWKPFVASSIDRLSELEDIPETLFRLLLAEVNSFESTVGDEADVIFLLTEFGSGLGIPHDDLLRDGFYLQSTFKSSNERFRDWGQSTLFQTILSRRHELSPENQDLLGNVMDDVSILTKKISEQEESYRKLWKDR